MNQLTQMKAAVYYGPGDVRIEQVPVPPPPGPDEVCLQVLTASLCGTDVSQFLSNSMIPLEDQHQASGHRGPVILGHEVCGRVIARGEQVTHLDLGDRVVVGAGMWCGACPRCLEGRPNICERGFVYGLHADGGLAERVLFPAKMCVRVPASCSSEAAALAQPLAVALHALERSRMIAGERVGIFGVGGIGSLLLAAIFSRPQPRPSQVIAVDIDDRRLGRAFHLGADEIINPLYNEVLPTIERMTDGQGLDLAIEVSGQSEMIIQAADALRSGGRLLQIGLPRYVLEEVPIKSMVLREQELLTSNGQRCQEDLPAALDLLATTLLASRVGTRPITLDELVPKGLLPQVEHRASEKVIVMIGEASSQ